MTGMYQSANAQVQLISTISGQGGGGGFAGDGSPASAGRYNANYMITTDAAGNLYIADNGNARIRKITASTGIITTVAGSATTGSGGDGGPATAAQLGGVGGPNSGVVGVAVDASGNIFIADGTNHRIRKVDASTGIITTICGSTSGFSGDGSSSFTAQLNAPRGICVDAAGNLYIADAGNQRIRKISGLTGMITTVAGNGTGGYLGDNVIATNTRINNPRGVTVDAAGYIYIADMTNSRIRRVDPVNDTIITVVGTGTAGFSGDGGAAATAQVNLPTDMKFDAAGNMLIADVSNGRIRMVTPAGIISTVAGASSTAGFAGDGTPATSASVRMSSPTSIAPTSNPNYYYISDRGNNRIRYVKPNSIPYFTGGTTMPFVVCQNTVGDSLNALLQVRDSDLTQTLTWSVVTPANHGGLVGSALATSNAGAVTPTGLFYTPAFGYSGLDTFTIQISDGFNTSTTTVYVTVNPLPVVAAIGGSNTVCLAGTTTLTDATGGGTWSATNANASVAGGVVTGLVLGVDTINYAVTNACGTTTVSKVVTVITTPAIPAAITGPGTVCAGSGIILNDATIGGVWTSSATGTATVGSLTGGVTGVAAGTANISYTVTNACGSAFVFKTITVNVAPGAISGSAISCVGASNSLTSSPGGGAWTSSNTAAATVGSLTGSVTGVGVGNSTISYTLGNGCFSTLPVTVNAPPASITGSLNVCVGGTTTLTDGGGGTWTSGTPGVATIGSSTGVVTAIAPGTSVITYAVGGCSVTATVTVAANPAAITPATPVNICVGATASLGDVTPAGAWTSSASGVASVSGTGVVTGVSAGSATISYTVSGCSSIKTVTVLPTPTALSPVSARICVGLTATFTESVTGGIWSSSASGTASVVGGVVTGVAAGTATISYAIGTCSVTAPVTVVANPAAITPAGGLSICVGSTGSMADITPGGVWSSGATGIATVGTSGTVTGVGSGVTTISYTVGGCSSLSPVTVNTVPVAISPTTATVCPGSTVTLTDATPGGTWTSTAPSVATVVGGVVTGVTAGTATISYALGICAVSASVTVNAAPNAGTISGPNTVCTGLTISLTDATSGGVWSSSNPGVATVGTTGIVTGVSLGSVTISYSVTNSCGTAVATYGVTVTAAATAGVITGLSSLCAGSFTIMTETVTGGVWSVTNTNASITGTGVVTGITPGIDTVKYTVTNACGTVSAVHPINIGPFLTAGTITGASTVCQGSTITLADATPGGVWSSSSTGVATISSGGVVTGMSGGTTTISYTVTSSCGSISATKVVNVTPTPIAGSISGSTTICEGMTGLYTDAAPGGTWSVTNGNATISGGGSLTAITAGVDTVVYTVTNSCGTATAMLEVTIGAAITAGSISGSTTVCEGASITLTDGTPGGVWSASNANATVVGGIVTGVSAGIVDISYTVTSACGSASAVVTILVDPLPDPGTIAGPSVVCVGTSITLTDAALGGVWSASNANATVVGGVVTGISSGTDDISYTVTNGCGTASAVSTILISVTPFAGTISGPSNVCPGASITLTDAAPGGTWSASNTNATVAGGIVTGVTAGTVDISYTVTTGCGTASTSVTIVVDPLPDAGTITGPTNVCIGATITLTDAAPGGVWSASNTNATVSGGVVTGVTAGTDDISYTVTNVCGTASAVSTISIDPLPDAGAITGIPFVCVGTTTTLADAAPGGVWSASNANATVSGGVVTGVSAGTVDISYSVTNSCGTAVASATITVNDPPTVGAISGPTTVCKTSTITLTNGTAGGVWSATNSRATVTSAGLVTGVATGIDTIKYTVSNACGSVSAMKAITVIQTPSPGTITGASTVCEGATIILTDPVTGGAWSSSSTSTATVSGGVVTGVATGSATIYYTVSNVCGTRSATHAVAVLSASDCSAAVITTAAVQDELKVYPNPNKGVFSMNLIAENEEQVNVVITNIIGKKVKEFNTATNRANEIQMNVAPGIYLLTATTVNGRYVTKVTIE